MSQFFLPRAQIVDVAGRPVSGAKLYFYAAGTTTPLTVYADVTLVTPLAQPVVANSSGIWAAIYTPAGLYKAIVTDASDVLIWSQDNIDPAVSTSLGVIAVANGGTGASTAAGALASLGAASAASLSATQVDLVTNYYSKLVNPIATQAEALAGTDATRLMSALSVSQVLAARGAAPEFWFRDEKAQNTAGGTFTTGADQTRTLNTSKRNVLALDFNGSGGAAANQIVFTTGSYWVEWRAPALGVSGHQSWLANVTDATVIDRGSTESALAADGTQSHSVGRSFFTITSNKVCELRHRCLTTNATEGFGRLGNIGTEVYAEIWGWRIQP